MSALLPAPFPSSQAGRAVLQSVLSGGGVLSALEAVHHEMGAVFRLPLPGFSPVFLVGPEANHFMAVSGRQDLRWRAETDPVTRLLRQGLLVTDGEQHDHLRRLVSPALHKARLAGYVPAMVRRTDQVMASWSPHRPVDMLVEMRKVALLILADTLFGTDLSPDLETIWPALLRTLAYISPGLWVVWPGIPRPGYRPALRRMDAYLYGLIAGRRKALAGELPAPSKSVAPEAGQDMLSHLASQPGLDDNLIRDQLLTILIAGHDTSTALLAWTLYFLGRHPEVRRKVLAEVDAVVGAGRPDAGQAGRLDYLDQVIHEALRLYPPIHLGNRRAAADLEFQGYRIPAGTRVVYSIYLTHRQERYWPDPRRFDPERFAPEQVRSRPPYTYVPFGGGPRNCIGLAFAQVEVKIVLARLLQAYEPELQPGLPVHPHMGATLEPRPGVVMRLNPRC